MCAYFNQYNTRCIYIYMYTHMFNQYGNMYICYYMLFYAYYVSCSESPNRSNS